MIRGVLLDTNIVIGAYDGAENNAAHTLARARLEELLNDPEVRLAITPLIRYEVLRGLSADKVAEMEVHLGAFVEFDIGAAEARRAAAIFRLAREAGKRLDKRSFDLFHYASAEANDLEIASQDDDIAVIKAIAMSDFA